MSREEYELEAQADQMGVEVFRKGDHFFYRLTEKGLEGLPEDFNNEPVGPYTSYLKALRAATA